MSNKSNAIDVGWLSQQIGRPTLYNIVSQISRLVERKTITTGTLLPTIRMLASELAISPTTVATAYSELRARNIVQSKRRVGTVVIDNPVTAFPSHFTALPSESDLIAENNTVSLLDLSYSNPDCALLPKLNEAINFVLNYQVISNIKYCPIVPELKEAISLTWPYLAKNLVVFDNIFEAITHLLKLFIPPNASVAIENPTTVNILDKLKRTNIKMIPVECDREGPIISSLAKALAKKPALFIYQPREHLATGYAVSKKRMEGMAQLLKSSKTLVIENDIVGDLSFFPSYSIGQYFPDRTIYIRSYVKGYGVDLCFSILSAPDNIAQQLYNYRISSIGWSNRLLQYTLGYLLLDKKTQQGIKKTKRIYDQRYCALLEALKKRKIDLPYHHGLHLFLCLPVPSEQQALSLLQSKDVIGFGGSQFMVNQLSQQFIRIMTTHLSTVGLINYVADAIAYTIGKINST